ncbi:hypothetical protein H9Q69_004700 [Fusarium xylarioides]|nr:hypothetical protein H9Q69_004700 [Fusarium xylarioides]
MSPEWFKFYLIGAAGGNTPTAEDVFYNYACIHSTLMLATRAPIENFVRYSQNYVNPEVPDQARLIPKHSDIRYRLLSDHWCNTWRNVELSIEDETHEQRMGRHHFGDPGSIRCFFGRGGPVYRSPTFQHPADLTIGHWLGLGEGTSRSEAIAKLGHHKALVASRLAEFDKPVKYTVDVCDDEIVDQIERGIFKAFPWQGYFAVELLQSTSHKDGFKFTELYMDELKASYTSFINPATSHSMYGTERVVLDFTDENPSAKMPLPVFFTDKNSCEYKAQKDDWERPLRSFGLLEGTKWSDHQADTEREETKGPKALDPNGEWNTKALRIAPNEIHISDPSIHKIIYSQTAPYDKPDSFYQCFNNPHSLTSETDQSLHRERRRLLNPYFSKKAVGDLSPLVWSKIEKLENKLRIPKGPLDAYDAVRCLTVEVITKFCFGIDVDLIDENQVSFEASFLDTFDAASHSIVDMVFAPTFKRLKFIMPMPILVRIDKEIANLLRLGEWAQDCLNHWAKGATLADQSRYPIIFDCLKHLPDRTKKAQAVDILAAGSDTTALTLTYGIFHILSNPAVKQRLVDELDAALPDAGTNPSLSELEKLPYLLHEGVTPDCITSARKITSHCTKGRAPLIVDGKVIPSGTIVGMSAYSMHRDENVWGQDAYEFKPERWLDGADKNLDQFLCPFSKGQRSCIGQNLAMAEIRLMFAMFFRRFHIDLCPSSTLSKPHDCFTIQLDRPGLLITCSPKEK